MARGAAAMLEERMTVDVREATISDRTVIERMMQLYQHDFSEFDGNDLGGDGLYGYDGLGLYWSEPACTAHLVTVAGKWAGFVLTSDDVCLARSDRAIDEFFVVRKYRRRGVGKQVAIALFDRTPGRWEVRIHARNAPADEFWRNVVTAYTHGEFEDIPVRNDPWHRALFAFESGRRPATP
jgi:predicted acetyltransferase